MAGQPGNQNAVGRHIYPANRASRSSITGTRFVPVVTKFASGKQVVQSYAPVPPPPPKAPHIPKPVKVHVPAKPHPKKVVKPKVHHPVIHKAAVHHPVHRRKKKGED